MSCCFPLIKFTAHNLDEAIMGYLKHINFYIKFLFINIYIKIQPANMGMVLCSKIGYNNIILNILVDIFDEYSWYELTVEMRNNHPVGCKVLLFGGKSTVLDDMEILNDICKVDSWGTKNPIRQKSDQDIKILYQK